ncbi:hypothetical protein AAFF_G00323230 [Aldrovandia affinis]|uniref:Uncharacterized protein n=1 Tax=Aldrovandia affinis TaxID=143900 RepID=A0AAD7SMD1_9TELE|nr:hypothetical protein AAFF_G00323230 [Aldrovandia affinis]
MRQNGENDLKKENTEFKSKCGQMEQKVKETDHYSRRPNLHLYGVPERADENIIAKVKDICRASLPEGERSVVVAAIDVVHRLGRHRGRSGENQTQWPAIMRCISRTARDMMWKGLKKNDHLTANHL